MTYKQMGIPTDSFELDLRRSVQLSLKLSLNDYSSARTRVTGRTPAGKQAVFQNLVYSLIMFIWGASSFLKEQWGNTGEINAEIPLFCHFLLSLRTKFCLSFKKISNYLGDCVYKALMASMLLPFLSSLGWKKVWSHFIAAD